MFRVDQAQVSIRMRRFCSHFCAHLRRENRYRDVNDAPILTGCSHFPRRYFPLIARVRGHSDVNKMLTEKKDPYLNISDALKIALPDSKGFQHNLHLRGFGFRL